MTEPAPPSPPPPPTSPSPRPPRIPAEWHENRACWLAWPSHPAEWGGDLEPARREVAALAAAIRGSDAAGDAAGPLSENRTERAGEAIEMLVLDDAGEASARAALAGVPARFHRIPFGDIWLRDTGPMFGFGGDGALSAARFRWDGWGGKYLFPHDPEVGDHIARVAGAPATHHPFVLEGGAIDLDGEGTALTTRQCLLDPVRNPGVTEDAAEAILAAALGVDRVVWLDRGLANDHTDGHVDTLARFVAPAVVACMLPGPDDPNRDALTAIAGDLARARDARGRRLELVALPAPGAVRDPDGQLMPASYVNFYLGNRRVIVPTYGARTDDRAVAALAPAFPDREVIGLSARAILAGGGAFHCITRQEPRRPLHVASRRAAPRPW